MAAKLLGERHEAALVPHVLYMADRGFPLSKLQIKALAKEVLTAGSARFNRKSEKQPSEKWLRNFIRRNPKLTVFQEEKKWTVQVSAVLQLWDLKVVYLWH